MNNRLTNHPIYKDETYDIITEAKYEEIVCENPDKKPSEVGSNYYTLLPETKIDKNQGYKNIRFSIEAYIYINDSVDVNNYANIVFSCYSKNTSAYSPDKIVRYIDEDTIRQGHEYKLELKKTFTLDPDNDNMASVSIMTPNHDVFWTPNSKITIKNAIVTVECSKQ